MTSKASCQPDSLEAAISSSKVEKGKSRLVSPGEVYIVYALRDSTPQSRHTWPQTAITVQQDFDISNAT
jgi:hypothetical protein